MSITPRGMSIQEGYRLYRDNKLIVNRKYQRKLVWTLREKQHLIDSIIKDYPIPLILLAEINHDGNTFYEIIDGMQRLNAIFNFIENEYSIDDQYFDIDQFSRAKLAYSEGLFSFDTSSKKLPSSICADILDYQLAVTIFPVVNGNTVTDIFGRINSGGRQLSAQDKRQAGMIDDFSMLVRKLSSEIRGDDSNDQLPLSKMPEISIDSNRADLGYALKADEIFWCKQGILWAKQLRDSEDEEMVVDICASLLLEEPIARSKELFDKIYNEDDDIYLTIRRNLHNYGIDKLTTEVKVTLSVLKEVIDEYDPSPNALRKIVNPSRNPIKTSFYAIFMAFYRLVIEEEKTPDKYVEIMNALKDLQQQMISSANYATTEDRIKNIDKTVGLIQRFFVKKEPPLLNHGAGLALDVENSLRRSRLETSRYECKQGILSVDHIKKINIKVLDKLINTVCGMANIGPDVSGYFFIGVADTLEDAEKIAEVYGIKYEKIGHRYIVGVEREAKALKLDLERYIEKIVNHIRTSQLADSLKTQILTKIDVVEIKGKTIIRLHIPAQNEISFVGDNAYIRDNTETRIATAKELIALSKLF